MEKKPMIEEYEIRLWISSAKQTVERSIQAGEAHRASAFIDLIGRLERELASRRKKIKEEVPF